MSVLKKIGFGSAVAVGVAAAAIGGLVLGLMSCVAVPPKVGSIPAADRVEAFPAVWDGLRGEVTVLWDDHMIPSIHASRDDDVPYVMGLIHAHLRIAQMEMIRKVSRGRLSEMGGPLVNAIDRGIRAIDLDRAVPEMERRLPDETRVWLERYVRGINDFKARMDSTPADFRTLALSLEEQWTVRDVLAVGRLASVDINWGRWLSLMPMRGQEGYDDYLARLRGFADDGRASFGPSQATELDVLMDVGKTGSNAWVLSGDRSAGAGALLASDPHLGIAQPNLWVIVAYRSPSQSVAGLTIPGLPFVLVGRNESIGWTGTNMQAASSILYRLPDGWEPVGERTEEIGTRWWFDDEARVRESDHGPVLTDVKVLRRLGEGDIAMRWRGHQWSDEASTFLRLTRATSFGEFRDAFRDWAVGGQNFLYADARGNIGQVMALEAVPAAGRAALEGPVDPLAPRYAWGAGIPSTDLPFAYNPVRGYLVSANNTPVKTDPPVTPQGNSNDRVERIAELIDARERHTVEDMRVMQRDAFSRASLAAARALASAYAELDLTTDQRALIDAIASWDGHYTESSNGAVAYQALLRTLIDAGYEARYSEGLRGILRRAPYAHSFVEADAREGNFPEDALRRAVAAASGVWNAGPTWGEVHRLRIAHPIGAIPWLGSAYRYDEIPTAGSVTTVHKSAHAAGAEKHRTTFGAQSRVVFDMGTLDGNHVVLLGGQDGWMGSDRLINQVDLWRSGEMIPLPLSAEGQEARARWRTTLRRGAGAAAPAR